MYANFYQYKLSHLKVVVYFPGEGNGTPLQYSCLENPMDRGAKQTTVRGVARIMLLLLLLLLLSHFSHVRLCATP